MTEQIVEKISKYNLFNYLFPGVLFIIFAPTFEDVSLLEMFEQNIILYLFFAYFIGMVISRLGSLVVESVLKFVNFIEFTEHSDYLEAAKKDPKIDILSEENNVYRTLIALFVLLLIGYGLQFLLENFPINIRVVHISLLAFSLLVFLFSYRKQTNYVRGRVLKTLNKEKE